MTNSLTKIDDLVIESKHHNKPIVCDVRYLPSQQRQPVVIFIHGFKGFKDWGHWNLIADQIAQAGYIFIKINLSHNGTTLDKPLDFADLEAFSDNTYSLELEDVKHVIDYLQSTACTIPNMDLKNTFLIGHSRGGGIALISAFEDERIKGVVTWASVSDYEKRWPEDVLAQWKKEGVHYVYNGRTKQNMPMKYAIVEDFLAHKERLNIKNAVAQLKKPALFIHGSDDPTVDLTEAKNLESWSATGRLVVIEKANHVFNGKHPYEEKELPVESQKLVKNTLSFLEQNSR